MKKDFNEFRFSGLNYREYSNKYLTMDRVNEDKAKVVVRVADEHLMKTKYGYALILNRNHVVFLKDWQVNQNYFGNEVMLTKQYFNIKEWGDFDDFDDSEDYMNWDKWVAAAIEQDSKSEDGGKVRPVKWEK